MFNMKNVLLIAFAFSTATLPAQTADLISDSLILPEMTFEEQTHDFGTLPKGGNTTTRFYFKNTGKSPLVIAKCTAGCGCTTPKCPTEVILPGERSFIEVHYDSMRVGPFTKTVNVQSNAKTKDVLLKITGNIIEDIKSDIPVDNKKTILAPK